MRSLLRGFSCTIGGTALLAGVAAMTFLCPTLMGVATALAQDAALPIDTGSSIGNTILTAIAAALPGVLLGGWAWFKAHAAQSEAAWDDWMVARVEKVARGIVEKADAPPASPASKGT